MNEDFDETILDNGEEFKKRFKEIERPDRLNFIINKTLREVNRTSQTDKKNDELIKKLLKD